MAVVLAQDDPARRLGPALAWMTAQQATELRLVVDPGPVAAVLARRATAFDVPIDVVVAEGTSVVPTAPAPRHEVRPAPEGIDSLVDLITASGAEVVVEHGIVTAEVLGLEVARVVEGPEGHRLEVGVGRHDREAFAIVHGNLPAPEALDRVIDAVRGVRVDADGVHPLRRLVPERRLRSALLAEPGLAGATSLEPAEGTLVRESLADRAVAVAVGATDEGPVVVGCTVGLDLDAVPAAAEARDAHAPGAELRLVLPDRDRLGVVDRLLALLRRPGVAVGVAPDLA